MSFAFRGITHCDECGTRLGRNEFVVCDVCRERAKEENKQTTSVNASKDKVSKTYEGYELIQAIVKGKIKNGTQFLAENRTKIYYDGSILRYKEAYCGIKANTEIGMSWLRGKFELIEEEIDIQGIEEINIDQVIETDDKSGIALLHINKLIQAVNQLDKRTRKEKE